MKKNLLSIILVGLLCFPIFLMAGGSVHAVSNEENQADYFFEETKKGFILRCEQIEDDKVVYYDETHENNVTYTKKYIKDNDELLLLEEFTTTINSEENGSIAAIIYNVSDNTSSTYIVSEEEDFSKPNQDFIQLLSQKRHPLASDYVLRTRKSGHLGFSSLSKAAIIGVISTLITGGNVKAGALAAVATFVLNGGYRHLYYSREHYIAYGSKAGRPLWKRIVRLYYDKNRTNQLPGTKGTIYIDSDILTRR